MTFPAFHRAARAGGTAAACLAYAFLVTALAAQEAVPAGQASAAPPPVRRLTLDEARQIALANNKSLALARMNVAEKQTVADAARTDYFPKVLGSATYFHFNEDLGSVVTATRGDLGILPPGIRTLDVSVLNQNTELSTVMLAQPITKLIAVNAAVQIATADRGAAQAQLDKGTRDLLSGVAQVYHGLLGALRIQAALELQIEMLEQAVAASPNPELRIGLLEAKQGLLQVRGQVQELTDQLAGLLDFPLGTRMELIDPVPADLQLRCPEEAAELALTCSPEVREAQQSIAKAEAALRVAKMDYLPDVNVIGGFANQSGVDSIQPDIGYVGLSASYTFWDWGKRRDLVRQRETDIAMARQNVQVTADKVRADARKAYGGLQQAREAYQLAGQMVQARADAEHAAAGPAAAQAKADSAKAQLELMKAEIGYRVAHAQLAGIIGRQ